MIIILDDRIESSPCNFAPPDIGIVAFDLDIVFVTMAFCTFVNLAWFFWSKSFDFEVYQYNRLPQNQELDSTPAQKVNFVVVRHFQLSTALVPVACCFASVVLSLLFCGFLSQIKNKNGKGLFLRPLIFISYALG